MKLLVFISHFWLKKSREKIVIKKVANTIRKIQDKT